MKNKIRRFDVNHYIQWWGGNLISDMREELDQMEAKGATHLLIDVEENYGSASISFQPYVEREETDSEAQQRLNEQAQKEANIRIAELQQLAMLRKKYGDINQTK